MQTVQDMEGHSSLLGFLPCVRSVRMVERITDATRDEFPPIGIPRRCSMFQAGRCAGAGDTR